MIYNTNSLTDVEKAGITIRQELLAPTDVEIHNEQSFELLWHTVVTILNRVLYVCAKRKQNSEYPTTIWIGNGAEATFISQHSEPNAEQKKPDFASYEKNLDSRPTLSNKRFNKIPGDAKLSAKINHAMLPPNGKEYHRGRRNAEAKKVLSQIHGYMDRHEARYGYIVTDKELIFLRRREGRWGQLDIAPPVKHNVWPNPSKGILNSKYVLFYFHWVVAQDDSANGWRLRSYGKDRSEELKNQRNLPVNQDSATTKVNRAINKKCKLLRMARKERKKISGHRLSNTIR